MRRLLGIKSNARHEFNHIARNVYHPNIITSHNVVNMSSTHATSNCLQSRCSIIARNVDNALRFISFVKYASRSTHANAIVNASTQRYELTFNVVSSRVMIIFLVCLCARHDDMRTCCVVTRYDMHAQTSCIRDTIQFRLRANATCDANDMRHANVDTRD
jgi:hypothetical protein